jgi:DNA-directed RNA polymerase specialized sigma24 family protein
MAETKKALVARLFAEHRGALQAFLYRRVRRRPDAAELAQEVYVRLLRVPDIGAIRDPGAYLYTVASNLARDLARRERSSCSPPARPNSKSPMRPGAHFGCPPGAPRSWTWEPGSMCA